MVSGSRWQEAQRHERRHWEQKAQAISREAADRLTWYEWRARLVNEQVRDFLPESQRDAARVLEIGSGPVGTISFLGWGERYAVDPLEEFYSSNAVLTELRDPAVHFRPGRGEELPWDGEWFKLVLLDNVIDHVQDAGALMREIHRLLQPDGLLYFAVNLHTPWGGFLHRLLAVSHLDSKHPYTFTLASIRRFLAEQGFAVRRELVDPYREARQKDRASRALSDRLKGYSGLSEFVYRAICSKAQV